MHNVRNFLHSITPKNLFITIRGAVENAFRYFWNQCIVNPYTHYPKFLLWSTSNYFIQCRWSPSKFSSPAVYLAIFESMSLWRWNFLMVLENKTSESIEIRAGALRFFLTLSPEPEPLQFSPCNCFVPFLQCRRLLSILELWPYVVYCGYLFQMCKDPVQLVEILELPFTFNPRFFYAHAYCLSSVVLMAKVW